MVFLCSWADLFMSSKSMSDKESSKEYVRKPMLIFRLKFILILLKIAKTTIIEQNNLRLFYALPQIRYLEAVQKTFSAEYI